MIATRAHPSCRDGALRALFINDNTYDLNVLERSELLEHLFAVGHLRHRFRRYETHRVDVLEARRNQLAQIFDLPLSRNLTLQSLPRIAWTFDDLDGFHHGKLLAQ